MPLSLPQLKDVCLLGCQAPANTCRYLDEDDVAYGEYHCLKLNKSLKKEIDKSVSFHLTTCRQSGVDPYILHDPIGDNCQGYPVFKHVIQGYDKP